MSLDEFHQKCLQGDDNWVSNWLKNLNKKHSHNHHHHQSPAEQFNVDGVDSNGCTGLQLAAAGGHLNIVKLLTEVGGASVDTSDYTHGNTPLHEAAWRGFSNTVKYLCEKKAKIKQNKAGFSPLHLSCQAGHNQSTREILLHRADTDVKNTYGDSPLHTAVRYGHAGVARILLSARACPHPVNKNNDTPLHISCAMSHRKLTRILLESGSKTELINNQGERPIDISRRKNYESITNILLSPPPVHSLFNRDFMRESKREKAAAASGGEGSGGVGKGSRSKDVNWSPYGCHYHPGTCFQGGVKEEQLRVESLPAEPLKGGELYYIDLGGNIRKGPMGTGGRCFCYKERSAVELEELNLKLSKLELSEQVKDGLITWVEEYREFKKELRKSRRKRKTMERVNHLIDSANHLLGYKNDDDDVDSGI